MIHDLVESMDIGIARYEGADGSYMWIFNCDRICMPNPCIVKG